MDGACRDVAFQPCLDVLQDRAAVRILAEPNHGQQNRLLKCTDDISH
jgi:hypothetical protein